ncbi:MAG: hydroxymethylbilane synthase [Candidatus Omnitrophica bacterium]|nr:hydroxymethylbilane synthase [Candidatus Omnitrophota bacterium]
MTIFGRRTYRIGTRRSPLALKQVEEVLTNLKKFYPDFKAEMIGIDTYGDKDKITPIWKVEGTDFFTREIEEALLKGEVDFAVHSAKDLPDKIPDGLTIVAITKSIDPYDALVSKNNLKIDELPIGAKIGASSFRRKTQLKKYRDDFRIIDVRGDIEERLKKLETDNLDAIIVAACALVRLGLECKIAQRIPFEILKPHPLQGSLAIEVRGDNKELIDLLQILDGN